MVPEQPRHVGDTTLGLLTERWSVPILRVLMVGPRRPSEVEQRLPGIPHAAVMRRLGELEELGLAEHDREVALNPVARYTLTHAGRMILDVPSAAERWEHRWSEVQAEGMDALRLIADQHTREALLALAPGAAAPSDLEQSVALTRAPLRRRLCELAALRVLERTGGANRALYGLTDSARALMLVSIAAAKWEWDWKPPEDSPRAVNVAYTLQMFGPCTRLAADMTGCCALQVADDGDSGSTVHLEADGREIRNVSSPYGRPCASCHGTPRAWCHGLLRNRWEGVLSDGNRELMGTILSGLSATLLSATLLS